MPTKKCPYCGSAQVLIPKGDINTYTFACGTQMNWIIVERTQECREGKLLKDRRNKENDCT